MALSFGVNKNTYILTLNDEIELFVEKNGLLYSAVVDLDCIINRNKSGEIN